MSNNNSLENNLSMDFFESIVNDLFLDSDDLIQFDYTENTDNSVKKPTPVVEKEDLRNQDFSKIFKSAGVDVAPAPAPLPIPSANSTKFVAPAPAPLPLYTESSNNNNTLIPLSPLLQADFDSNLGKRYLNENDDGNNMYNKMESQRVKKITKKKLNCSSKYRGISIAKDKCRARIKINKKTTHLGYYETEELAAKAYDRAAYVLRGSKTKLNFPVDPMDIPEFSPTMTLKEKVLAAAKSVGGCQLL